MTSPESGGITTRKRIIVGGLRKQKFCDVTLPFLEVFDPPRLKRKILFIYCTAAPPGPKPSRKQQAAEDAGHVAASTGDHTRPKCIALRDALFLLASRQGNVATVAQLLDTVNCAYLVHETVVRQPDLNQFSAAEVALHKCTIGGEITGKFDVPPEGQIAIQRVLSIYEKRLVSIPARIVVDAESRLVKLLPTESEFSSPIASSPDARPHH
ncbi:hypothetical protein [Burkholderia sp. GbtcB21]|uniref:hypothetical protein n=1 Tax=Burkholderia sp. GbtcB21 TaxID=2824766 RepID=UPI001C30D77B|nr:hypothetical protein [Burkholderia sp. GbtcB21]